MPQATEAFPKATTTETKGKNIEREDRNMRELLEAMGLRQVRIIKQWFKKSCKITRNLPMPSLPSNVPAPQFTYSFIVFGPVLTSSIAAALRACGWLESTRTL